MGLRDRLAKTFSCLDKDYGVILDLGGEITDLGFLGEELCSISKTVVVVNLYEPSIRCVAERKVSGVLPTMADATCLGLKSGSLDAVVMNDVLEHVQDDKAALQEVLRVLAPRGRFILSVPHSVCYDWLDPMNIKVRWSGLYSRILSWFGKGRLIRQDAPFHRHYSFKGLERLLSPYFSIVEAKGNGGPIYVLSDLIKNLFEKIGIFPVLQQFLCVLMYCDYLFSYGALSYNLFIVARKEC